MCEMQFNRQGWLSDDAFLHVIAHTPLVSLDFVVTNYRDEWLLGQRVNRPAQGSWFVPGGRVRKGETLERATVRLTAGELGQAIGLEHMHFLGVYQHFYSDSMLDPEVPTHYLVLAYQVTLELEVEHLPRQQHTKYRWWSPHVSFDDDTVHANTLAYKPAVSVLTQN
ncbi:GDP-mannose mannosyl hydrolase [Halomonas salinarum]|uniref:GDP-mannose mannosyl hydrolase n=1 Tax=Halomonas salinarum TaxID=1158993 RepID=UPI001ADE6F99|nr:GDP-mannose mannosyl hydrolase [Halomonas salinarum]